MKDNDRQNVSNSNSVQNLRSLFQKKRKTLLIAIVLVIVAVAFATQWISAKDENLKLKPVHAVEKDSKAAWNELQQSAQSRLRSANNQPDIVREIMNELVTFATNHSDTRKPYSPGSITLFWQPAWETMISPEKVSSWR